MQWVKLVLNSIYNINVLISNRNLNSRKTNFYLLFHRISINTAWWGMLSFEKSYLSTISPYLNIVRTLSRCTQRWYNLKILSVIPVIKVILLRYQNINKSSFRFGNSAPTARESTSTTIHHHAHKEPHVVKKTQFSRKTINMNTHYHVGYFPHNVIHWFTFLPHVLLLMTNRHGWFYSFLTLSNGSKKARKENKRDMPSNNTRLFVTEANVRTAFGFGRYPPFLRLNA